MSDEIPLCPVEDCGQPCEIRREKRFRRGANGRRVAYTYVGFRTFCPGHRARKDGKREGGFVVPLKDQHDVGKGAPSDLDRLLAAGRAYNNADVADDDAYHRALRNYIEAARLRTLRPITGLRRPFVVSRQEIEPGVVTVTFKEYQRSTTRRSA